VWEGLTRLPKRASAYGRKRHPTINRSPKDTFSTEHPEGETENTKRTVRLQKGISSAANRLESPPRFHLLQTLSTWKIEETQNGQSHKLGTEWEGGGGTASASPPRGTLTTRLLETARHQGRGFRRWQKRRDSTLARAGVLSPE